MDKGLNYLALARKAGLAELGEEPVGAAARKGKAYLIVVAGDASDHTWRRAKSYAAGTDQQCIRLEVTKDEMGFCVGRTSLAIAAITDPAMAGADTYATAGALAAAVDRLGPFDLILCGRRAMDGETGQVPPMLAAALGWPCVTNVERVEYGAEGLIAERRLENGNAQLKVALPAVISVCEYVWPLRLPGIMGKRRARQAAIQRMSAAQLGLFPDRCGLRGSLTAVTAMNTKFPGLRSGLKETDLAAGVEQLLRLCREVRG